MHLSISNAAEPVRGRGGWLRARLIPLEEQGVRRAAMDLRAEMIRIEPPAVTREEAAAYAAGWTISGLATLGTIIVVWLFAI
jgi:hypothetical protein